MKHWDFEEAGARDCRHVFMNKIDHVWKIGSEKEQGLFASLFVMEGTSALRIHRARSRLKLKVGRLRWSQSWQTASTQPTIRRGEGGPILTGRAVRVCRKVLYTAARWGPRKMTWMTGWSFQRLPNHLVKYGSHLVKHIGAVIGAGL